MGKYPGVMLYFDRLTFLDRLTFEQAGELFTAIIYYARDKKEPEFTDKALQMAWDCLCPSLDEDRIRYEKICERNKRAIERRWGKRDTSVCNGIPNTNTNINTNPNTKTNSYTTTTTNQPRNDLELAQRMLSRRRTES